MRTSITVSSFLLIALASELALAQCSNDADGDCIDDAKEQFLLQALAPILRPDQVHPVAVEGTGVPVSMSWLLSECSIMVGPSHSPQTIAVQPGLAGAVALLPNSTPGWGLDNPYKWGQSPTAPRSWPISVGLREGVYGRVWRPWEETHPHLISVQYYVFFTWNETAYSFGWGNHEGDWLGVDYCIDDRIMVASPAIMHAVYHNHGRQLFMTPEALVLTNGRPRIFTELGTNESWPNAGTRGKDGWPQSNGFATNRDWDDTFGASEYGICREHNGNGEYYDFVVGPPIPNIGEIDYPLAGDTGTFLLGYPGLYGRIAIDPPFAESDPPTGPPFQNKLWRRAFDGPWSQSGGPFDTDASGLTMSAGYTFSPIPQLADAFVNPNAVEQGVGSSQRPFTSIALGASYVTDGGQVWIQSSSTPGAFSCSKPVTLRALNGAVTIGQ